MVLSTVVTESFVTVGAVLFLSEFFSVYGLDDSHICVITHWWNFARTCTVTTVRTLFHFKVKGQGNFFVSAQKCTKLFLLNVEKIVVHNAVISLSIAWSVPEIFAIKVYSCPQSRSLWITREPLHLPWWNFAGTFIFTIARHRHPENFKVIGQRSRSREFLCVFLCTWC